MKVYFSNLSVKEKRCSGCSYGVFLFGPPRSPKSSTSLSSILVPVLPDRRSQIRHAKDTSNNAVIDKDWAWRRRGDPSGSPISPPAVDIGAAIGCEFYFIGDAQTLRRSPSTVPAYFESYAAIFLVSARTGRLILWERPLERRDTAAAAEQSLLQALASGESRHRYQVEIRRALEDERAQREAAIEKAATIIEAMAEEENVENKDTRPPRPYRRPKPPYPESAARAEVEAVIDVLVDVDARGEISRLEIARWGGYGLDQSVIDTVKQLHFFRQCDGVPIPMRNPVVTANRQSRR